MGHEREARRWQTACVVLLVAVHGAAALGKLADLPGFVGVLGTYRLFPAGVTPLLAILVTVADGAVAAGLLSATFRRRAAVLAVALATANALVLTLTLLRGIAVPNCGCFGVFLARPLTPFTPLEDLVLIGLALGVLARPHLRRGMA